MSLSRLVESISPSLYSLRGFEMVLLTVLAAFAVSLVLLPLELTRSLPTVVGVPRETAAVVLGVLAAVVSLLADVADAREPSR